MSVVNFHHSVRPSHVIARIRQHFYQKSYRKIIQSSSIIGGPFHYHNFRISPRVCGEIPGVIHTKYIRIIQRGPLHSCVVFISLPTVRPSYYNYCVFTFISTRKPNTQCVNGLCTICRPLHATCHQENRQRTVSKMTQTPNPFT